MIEENSTIDSSQDGITPEEKVAQETTEPVEEKVGGEVVQLTDAEKAANAATQPAPDVIPEKKKKLKLPLIIGIIAAVVVLAATAFFVSMRGSSDSSVVSKASDVTVISALIGNDGTAYIPLMDGTVITINDVVSSASITKDRKTIVVLLDDGTLYFTDTNQSSKTTIADNADSFSYIRNEGFFYQDEDSKSYKVTFADSAITELGKNVVFTVADDTLSVLYSTDDGKIYTMAADSTEGVKVGTYSNSVYMEAISNDGTISVWTLKSTDGVLSIVLNEGEEKTELGDVDYKYDYTNVSFTSDQGLVVITNTYSDTMWIKTPGADVEKVKLGNDIYRSNVFTANGYLSDQTTAKVDSIYALVEADSGCNVYNVTLSGDRERALSKVSNAYFANGNIIYEDQDKNLYYAAVKGADFEDGIKIASDVDSFKISDNGKYVYYMKDCENNEGSLYAYQIGKIEPKKIGSNIGCYVSSYWSYGYYQISEDGSSVYYEKDVEEIADTYSSYGTLMKWSYTSEESERISSDVIVNSLQSALKSGEVKDKGFMFLKYSSVDSDDNIIYDWMFYNGTESIKLASDVIK